jgi:hypothetical protein
LIDYLAQRGFKREEARKWLAERGMGLDNNRWATIAGRYKPQTISPQAADRAA